MPDDSVKLCECGCGQPTAVALRSDKARGYVRGQPKRFVAGHYAAKRSGPNRRASLAGAKAAAEKRRQKGDEAARAAGVDPSGPRNQWGQLCVVKSCESCGKRFLAQWVNAEKRKTCSRKCAAVLKQAATGGTRKGATNPNYSSGKRVDVRDREGERRWYSALKAYCEHPACKGPLGQLALHHCVTRQELRKAGGDVWDPRNAMTLCASCHSSHHHRTRPVPLTALPDSVFVFAAEVLGRERAYNYLSRVCTGDDARLAALLGPLDNERRAA